MLMLKKQCSRIKLKKNQKNICLFISNYFDRMFYFYLLKLAASIGLAKGLIEGFPKDFSLPKKLLINNFFNSAGK